MGLSPTQAVIEAKRLLEMADQAKSRLDRIHSYLRDDPNDPYLNGTLPGLPANVPQEMHRLARISRVNMMKFIVNSRVQSCYVDGFRAPDAENEEPSWDIWQRNKMDARQIGLHRAAFSFGCSYAIVLPGTPVPTIRGVSPRQMEAFYAHDGDDWPVYALESRGNGRYRLYDDEFVHELVKTKESSGLEHLGVFIHGAGHPPVVRYRETIDFDSPNVGIVEPLFDLQNQINLTTFGLLVAQHYGAFKQRAILGWMAESEAAALKMSASSFLTIPAHPDDVKFHEFSQTELDGYINSREATIRHLANLSQTPAHELTGQLINLSAEALVAANASKQRAVTENQMVLGESHEQTLTEAGDQSGKSTSPQAWVRWRDTDSQAMSAAIDALGKAVVMLGVPPEELWEKIPGVTQQEVTRWKATLASGVSQVEVPALNAGIPANAETPA